MCGKACEYDHPVIAYAVRGRVVQEYGYTQKAGKSKLCTSQSELTVSVGPLDQPSRHGILACRLPSSATASPSAGQGHGEMAASQAGNVQDGPRASQHLRASQQDCYQPLPSLQCGACTTHPWAKPVAVGQQPGGGPMPRTVFKTMTWSLKESRMSMFEKNE